MGITGLIDKWLLRTRYRVWGKISNMLVEALLRAKREGIRDEIIRWQIEVTKRAHTARKVYEEVYG